MGHQLPQWLRVVIGRVELVGVAGLIIGFWIGHSRVMVCSYYAGWIDHA
ncbi:hypothetical protein [Lederbergia citrea]|uniref:Uncharacterized protein n=1 Tax=Lederbergia citrea TaxID=2833581 RepID=A0A942US13_9BACI|nr:hypothetical protein [Lederbergia citrea]MBS4221904.1 hypothetical protein [Lederbergia citrea]